MFYLSGALFLTSREHDCGFPIFQRNNENHRYTCVVNRNLEITKFLPILSDNLHFLPDSNKKIFDVGSTFSFMLFRHEGRLYVIDIRELDQVDAAVARFGDESYVSLQVLRGVSDYHPEYATHAKRLISKVAKIFPISERNKLKFIASEISLLSFSNKLWESAENHHSESETISSIYARYAKMSKHDLEILLADHAADNPHWCYIFITYSEIFGTDEFLYENGKDFVKRLIFDQVNLTALEVRILKIILEFPLEKTRILAEVGRNKIVMDEEIFTIIEELNSTEAFLQVMIHYHPAIDLVGELFRRRSGVVNAVIELISFLERFRHRIPESARHAVSRYLDRTMAKFNSAEIVDFLAKARPLETFANEAIFRRSPRERHANPGAKELLLITKRLYEL
ncbi:MAG: hypothetical protein P4M15_03130 [Alphaproteobacteria bacterium]|nr:hypothetical protein [Alphaproteobacteria bacterium]